jgi:predicted histidine transporter YuiF (NhaC family)
VEKYATVYLPSDDVAMAEVVQLGNGKKGDILNVFATYQAPTPQFEQQEQEKQGQGQQIEKTQNIKQKKSKGSIMYAGMFSLDLQLLKAYYEQEKVVGSIEKIVSIYMNEGVKEAREELSKILGYSISNNKFYEFLNKYAGGIRKRAKK